MLGLKLTPSSQKLMDSIQRGDDLLDMAIKKADKLARHVKDSDRVQIGGYDSKLNLMMQSREAVASYIVESRPDLLDYQGMGCAAVHDMVARTMAARYLTNREEDPTIVSDKLFVGAVIGNAKIAMEIAENAPLTMISALKNAGNTGAMNEFMERQAEAARYLSQNYPEAMVNGADTETILRVLCNNPEYALKFVELSMDLLESIDPLLSEENYEFGGYNLHMDYMGYTKDPTIRAHTELLLNLLMGNDALTLYVITKDPEFFDRFYDRESGIFERLVKGSRVFSQALIDGEVRISVNDAASILGGSSCEFRARDTAFHTHNDMAKSVIDDKSRQKADRLQAMDVVVRESETLALHCIHNHYSLFKELTQDKDMDGIRGYGPYILSEVIRQHSGVALELAKNHVELFESRERIDNIIVAGIIHADFARYLFENHAEILVQCPESLETAFRLHNELSEIAKAKHPELLEVMNKNGISMGYLIAERQGTLRSVERI